VNEAKNAAKERSIQKNTRGAKNAYKLAPTKKSRLFRKKARQLDEEAIRPPHANAAVQHYQAGFQLGKSKKDQLFALRQILEKCNEFNIRTHHLFIDFKAAYDTIIKLIEYYLGENIT
jgi:hypothetical protein